MIVMMMIVVFTSYRSINRLFIPTTDV
jgi:hypothetical protein